MTRPVLVDYEAVVGVWCDAPILAHSNWKHGRKNYFLSLKSQEQLLHLKQFREKNQKKTIQTPMFLSKVLLKHGICVPWLLCGTMAELGGWHRIVWPAESITVTNLALQKRFRDSWSILKMGTILPWNLLEKCLFPCDIRVIRVRNSVSETWGPVFSKPLSHVDLRYTEYRKYFYRVLQNDHQMEHSATLIVDLGSLR